jgi:hypothetical protein
VSTHPIESIPGRLAGLRRLTLDPPRFALELLLVAIAAAVYGGVRAVTEGDVERAVANAEGLLRVERNVGVAWEDRAQSAVLTSDTLVALANWVYIWGHWPVIVAAAVVLYRRRRASYVLLRNAIFISGSIGFLFFALLPVAPPRLIDLGLVDTVLERSHSYRALQPPALTNQYAAFPSLHFGWNLLVGIVLLITFSHLAVRVFAVAMPVAMALAVVGSANHYVLDVAGGGILVVIGLAVSTAIAGRRPPAPALSDDGPPAGGGSRRRGGPGSEELVLAGEDVGDRGVLEHGPDGVPQQACDTDHRDTRR